MTVTTTGEGDPAPLLVPVPSSRARRRPSLGMLAVAIALVPVVVAPIRALTRGWVAIGDNGLILMRAEDVLTANHPLLGTWTSASLGAGRSISNPGPLWFDVLAPFVRIAGPSVGFALGVMAANVAAIVLAAWAARRAGGEPAMLVITTLSAGLAWSMGSELLFDAWQPHAMLLPFWAFLVVVWALGTGDAVMLPVAVGLASLIVQTHLSFVYVLVIVGCAGVAAAVWSTRSTRSTQPGASWRRPVMASFVVAALAWIQPLADQVAGEGNLADLATAGRSTSGEPIGLHLGARLVASVVALPPWWARSGFSETIVATGVVTDGGRVDVVEGNVVGGLAAVVGLLAVAVVLAVTVVAARRRDRRRVAILCALAAIAVVAALVSMVLSPVNAIGLSPHQVRWLWPISTFVLAAPLVMVARSAPRVTRPVGVAAVSVLGLVALPTYAAPEGPTLDRAATGTVMQLLDELDGYRPAEPVVFDVSVLRFAEPYSGPVLAALARNGVDVVVTDEGMVRQVGGRRRADGTERRRVFLLEGAAASAPPEGSVLIAYADGLPAAERAELDTLRGQVVDAAGIAGLRLNDAGLDAVAAGRIDFGAVVLEPGGDATELDAAGWLTALITDGFVAIPDDQRATWERFAALDTQRARFTVGLFEGPALDP